MDLENRLAPQEAPASFLCRFRCPSWASQSILNMKIYEKHSFRKSIFFWLFFKWFSAPNVFRMLTNNDIKTTCFCGQGRKWITAFRLRVREWIEGRTLPKTHGNAIKINCEPTRLESQTRSFIFRGLWFARWTREVKTRKNGVASRFFFASFWWWFQMVLGAAKT